MAAVYQSELLGTEIDLTSIDARKALAKALMKLFDQWNLDNTTRLNLLGLSTNSRALLAQYRRGDRGLSNNRDALDRAGWLLAIHKALRLLYPQNEQLRHSWIKRRNRALGNWRPLDIMTERGIIGLANVSRCLDYQRGR